MTRRETAILFALGLLRDRACAAALALPARPGDAARRGPAGRVRARRCGHGGAFAVGAPAMTIFRPGDRVRCIVSTADELVGWELLGTLGGSGSI